jgi:hypothetical protein
MDELGVQRTLMFPTLASLVEERMRDDPELIHVVIHALNEWLHETWSFNYKDRIFTVPVISLPIVDKAIEELDWVVERGARAILVRPAPVPGFGGRAPSRCRSSTRSGDAWSRRTCWSRCTPRTAATPGTPATGRAGSTEMLPFKPNAFRTIGEWRPIQDAVAAWVCHGALFRVPGAEDRAHRERLLLAQAAARRARRRLQEDAERVPRRPGQAVKDSIHVSPFYEDDLGELVDLIGVDRVLFGSDYPHPEGLADPYTYLDALQSLSEGDQAKIMGGNLARLMS